MPYPASVRHRKLFAGAFAGGRWNEWTGSAVVEDFGTLSAPIVLCNATAVGTAYDALISYGHARDLELPADDGWPPVVIGIDDGYLNDLRQRRLSHDDVLRAIEQASDGAAKRGSVGIGRGLCALGGKGGVGDASRSVVTGEARYNVGVMVAANGGIFPSLPSAGALTDSAAPNCPVVPSFCLVVATDAPLLPEQLRRLAEAALRGLDAAVRIGALDRQLALAFSTGNTLDESLDETFRLYKNRILGEAHLAPLLSAAGVAARAALRRALEDAESVTGRKSRTVARLRPEDLARIAIE